MRNLTKFWDTNNMHRIFPTTRRLTNQWKVGKYPYLDFESENKEFLISKDFNYMGYRLIKRVESNHFQNKWHSWALIHYFVFFFPDVITTIYQIDYEAFLDGHFEKCWLNHIFRPKPFGARFCVWNIEVLEYWRPMDQHEEGTNPKFVLRGRGS